MTAPDESPSPIPRPRNLPLVMTTFFGRENEISALTEKLRGRGTRLVTVTGPGGSGKTRLVLETLRRSVTQYFPGGVCFVSLAELRDASRLPDTLLDALRLPRSPQASPMEQITEVLRRQEGQATLLVFDNFEHLVEEGSLFLKTLLFWLPDVSCLVTSRQRLQVEGEQEFPLPPLPAPEHPGSPKRLLEFSSVQLFVDRARTARPDFQITTANAKSIAALCLRLEGIPLALELAAAWSQVLTPAQILDRMEHRFDLLVSRRRDAPLRHATLRTTLEWSYRLLHPSLQRSFWQMSVFHGGWSLEAAAAVTGAGEDQTLGYITELRDRSLLITEEADEGREMRFRMLETLREFAAEQIPEVERIRLRRQHHDYFLAFAQMAVPRLNGPDQVEWIRRLEREHENLRSALAWSLTEPDRDAALRFATALSWFWLRRGHFREGRHWLETALAHAGREAAAEDTPGRALRLQALQGLASILYFHAACPEAERIYLESLQMAENFGDSEAIAFSLFGVGICAMNQVSLQGQEALERAKKFGEESLRHAQRSGSVLAVGRALIPLSIASFYLGDLDAAETQAAQCVALLRQVGEWWDLVIVLINQSVIRRHKGDHTGALASLREAIVLSRDENPLGTVLGIWGMAGAAGALNHPERAARLFGAAAKITSSLFLTVPEVWMERLFNPDKEGVRAVLGTERFDALEAEGSAMNLSEAIRYALETWSNTV